MLVSVSHGRSTSAGTVLLVVVQYFLLVILVGQLLFIVLPVARVLRYAVIATVVYDAQLLEHVTPDGRLYGPVVAVGGLVVTVQPLDVHDFRVEPLQYDANVFDGQVLVLLAGQLVDEQQELLAGHRVVLDHGGLSLGLGAVVGPVQLLLLVLPSARAWLQRLLLLLLLRRRAGGVSGQRAGRRRRQQRRRRQRR